MVLRWLVQPNAYHDSVKLMRVSEALLRLPGVQRAAAVMATPLNVELLREDGILPDVEVAPHDLLVAMRADTEEAANEALAQLDTLLAPRPVDTDETRSIPLRSVEEAAGADLALIAVPGQYAAPEAYAALRAGMHVFLFSDNVPIEDEVRLKAMAAERDLLMMGPDCGTAILGGVGLGFANRVRPGPVGIVGASGTGIQQVSCLLDQAGVGIAMAIGTGGRDLSAAVRGSMTQRALRLLDGDDTVEIIVLISKPADTNVVAELHRQMRTLSKPVVACLLGELPADEGPVRYAATLTDAAAIVADLQTGNGGAVGADLYHSAQHPGRVYGLFAGGTLCSEAGRLLDAMGVAHHLVDLGADEYTRGRAHPIIDPRLRVDMLDDLMGRDDVGAVLIDVILGDLAHPNPAEPLAAPLARLTEAGIGVHAVLVGTRADPQGYERQRESLVRAGALVYGSNALAASAAGRVVAS